MTNDWQVSLFVCFSSSAKAFEAIRCGIFIMATQLIPDLPVKAGLYWIYLGSAVFWELAHLADIMTQSNGRGRDAKEE